MSCKIIIFQELWGGGQWEYHEDDPQDPPNGPSLIGLSSIVFLFRNKFVTKLFRILLGYLFFYF